MYYRSYKRRREREGNKGYFLNPMFEKFPILRKYWIYNYKKKSK